VASTSTLSVEVASLPVTVTVIVSSEGTSATLAAAGPTAFHVYFPATSGALTARRTTEPPMGTESGAFDSGASPRSLICGTRIVALAGLSFAFLPRNAWTVIVWPAFLSSLMVVDSPLPATFPELADHSTLAFSSAGIRAGSGSSTRVAEPPSVSWVMADQAVTLTSTSSSGAASAGASIVAGAGEASDAARRMDCLSLSASFFSK
jgi:hypothetical protein